MTKEQIINLWKIGISKLEIYKMEFEILKERIYYENFTDLEIEKRARFLVDSIIFKEYSKKVITSEKF